MNLNSMKRPITLGLAMAGAGSAAAVVTLAAANAGTSHRAAPPVPVKVAATSDMASMPVAPAGSSISPSRPVPVVASSVTLQQARAIAERAGNGHADQAEITPGTSGGSYRVTVIRADGSEADFTIDAHTGRVLSNTPETTDTVEAPDAGQAEDTADPQPSAAPATQDSQDPPNNTGD